MRHLIQLAESLAEIFEQLDLRFAFGGALANNYWGIVRATQDVDCLVHVPALEYQALADSLTSMGCVVDDQSGKGRPISVSTLRQQVDRQHFIEVYWQSIRAELFVPIVDLQYSILRRAVSMPLEKRDIPVTSPEDLVLIKMAFHRDKDLLDVRGILWVQRGKLDVDYMVQWSERMLEDEVQRELQSMIADYGTDSEKS